MFPVEHNLCSIHTLVCGSPLPLPSLARDGHLFFYLFFPAKKSHLALVISLSSYWHRNAMWHISKWQCSAPPISRDHTHITTTDQPKQQPNNPTTNQQQHDTTINNEMNNNHTTTETMQQPQQDNNNMTAGQHNNHTTTTDQQKQQPNNISTTT